MDDLSIYLSLAPIVCFLMSVPALGLGILAYSYASAYSNQRKRAAVWAEAGRRAGLTFMPSQFLKSFMGLSGDYRGRPLRLEEIPMSGGGGRFVKAHFVMDVQNRSGLYLTLRDKDLFARFGRLTGSLEVQVDNEEFARRFIIFSRPDRVARRLVASSRLRAGLLQALSVEVEVNGPVFRFDHYHLLNDADYIQFLLDLLSDMAEFFEMQ